MTSSLVGSEMCIRDRNLLDARASSELMRLSLGFERFPGVVTGHMRALEAVSYTHLTLPTICSV
eukprot:11173257-Prorocentrum_lima.AAC.1